MAKQHMICHAIPEKALGETEKSFAEWTKNELIWEQTVL